MKNSLKCMALLGIASGLSLLAQAGTAQEPNSLDMSHLIAKPACKGSESCGGIAPEEGQPKKKTPHKPRNPDEQHDGNATKSTKDNTHTPISWHTS